MNHKQISELEEGDCIELLEDYEFKTDFGSQMIHKGTKLTYVYPVLGAWRFKFDYIQKGKFFGESILLGRSRLLKMRVRLSAPSAKKVETDE